MMEQTPRNGLMDLMDNLAQKRLLYIYAPAGCGKTVAAGLWLKRKKAETKYAWITIDEYDNRVAGFCRKFTATLLRLQPRNTKLRELAAHPSFNATPDEFAIHALDTFWDDAQKYILVIDDLHVIKNEEILKLLSIFYGRLSGGFTVLLLSRSAPPGVFADIALKNALAIVDAENLRFTEIEIKAFFEGNGRLITEKQAAEIYKATGGWAIGIRALFISGEEGFGQKLTGQYLESFLKSHVWDKWDEQTREYMKKASVVSELTPDLFHALTGAKKSADVLIALARENNFLSSPGGETFRFHDLFRDFLLNMLEMDGTAVLGAQMKKAGDWFYRNEDYYRAVEYYLKCDDKKGIADSLSFMYDNNSKYASIEDTAAIIHASVDDAIIRIYPFLLETLAWAAYIEGRAEDLEGYLDKYYKLFPRIVLQNPRSAITRFPLMATDHRKSLTEINGTLSKVPLKKAVRITTPSVTQNLPFFHRSYRDYSEYVFNIDENLRTMKKAFYPLLSGEYDMLEELVRAGLAYERGSLDSAYEYAASAGAKVEPGFAPEFQFCAFTQLAAVLEAQGRQDEAEKALADIGAMIERHHAYYLSVNFRAFSCRQKLRDGDIAAAQEWLESNGEPSQAAVSFYKIYRHFTSARAYISVGDLNGAILLLNKLLRLSEDYKRPLDVIEAGVLLAIAYWKKGRGEQAAALELLEGAIAKAYEYEYCQIFASEGADLVTMLHRLQKRAVQPSYAGAVPSTFIKSLYLTVLTSSKRYKGMGGGKTPDKLKFTDQQRTVMRLMCEGCSRIEIARQMGFSVAGVKSHLVRIFKKLDVSSSVDAVVKIKEYALLDGK